MTEEEIGRIVREALLADRLANVDKLDAATLRTISAILTSFGIDEDDRKDIAEDFRYLRRWRKGAERVTGIGLTALVTLLVGGVLSALWLGLRAMLGK